MALLLEVNYNWEVTKGNLFSAGFWQILMCFKQFRFLFYQSKYLEYKLSKFNCIILHSIVFTDIGPDSEFPYICASLEKNPDAYMEINFADASAVTGCEALPRCMYAVQFVHVILWKLFKASLNFLMRTFSAVHSRKWMCKPWQLIPYLRTNWSSISG